MNYQRVDPHDALPKYHQLYRILVQRIDEEEWKPYQSIPPERELEQIYQVSRTTVRQAISLLVSRGYLYREQGRGTFVSPPKMQHSLNLLRGFSESLRERGLSPGQKILAIHYVPLPPRIRQSLEIKDVHPDILNIERIRLANDEPIGYQSSYLSLNENQTISRKELESITSLYALLVEKFNLAPTEAIETLEASIADEQQASLLNIQVGSPLLLVEKTVWSQHHRPLEFLKAVYRGDKYKYIVHQTK